MKKMYSDIRFVKIENLHGRAKEVADKMGLKEGLAVLYMYIGEGNVPQYEIELVEGDPTEKLKEIGRRDGITQDRLNKGLELAFGHEKESERIK